VVKYNFSAFRRASAASVIGVLLIAGVGYTAKSTDNSNDATKGPSGTLSYQGIVSGSVTFPSADCAFEGHKHKEMVGFVAPHQDEHHPEIETPGPLISVGFFEPGAAVQFSTRAHPTDQNMFMRLRQKDGVSYSKKGDEWVVTITSLKMPNLDIVNQQWTTLSGTFVCTHLING
jgi:hypothetical protein